MSESPIDALLICAQDNTWLRALARRLIDDPDRGEDIAQDAVVVALEAEREKRHGAPWLVGVVRNLVANRKRQASRQRRIELQGAVPEAQPSAAESAERIEQQRILAKAVLGLEQPFRDVVVLRFYDGLERREIARRLELPIATVNSRLTRAVQKLRARLDVAHGGDRRAWMSALAPLVTAGGKGTILGVLTMKKVLAAAVAAVVLLFVGVWAVSPSEDVAPEEEVGEPAVVQTAAEVDPGEGEAAATNPTMNRTAVERPAAAVSDALVVAVVDAEGVARASRVVTVRVDGRLHDRGATDALGRVRFDHVPMGATVSSGSTSQRVQDGASTTVREVVLRLPAGMVIRGRVLDEGDRPVADAAVWLHRGGTDERDPITHSDADGAFVTDSQRSTVLEVRKDGYQVAWSRLVEGEAGSEHEVVVRLRAGDRQLSGVVFGLEGRPVPHARLHVAMETTASLRRGDTLGRNFEAHFDADEQGRFVVGWLPAGKGHVFATSGVGSEEIAAAWGALAAFDLRDQERAYAALHAAEVAAVSVRVLGADGEPLPDASVSANCRLTRFVSERPLQNYGRTGADGRCVLRGLFATGYRVGTSRGGESLQRQVDLVAGQTTEVELRWQPASTFEVELLDLAGVAHEGWRVTLDGRTFTTRSMSGRSDAQGIARLEGIVEGQRYRLAVFRPGQGRLPVLRRSEVDTTVPRLTLRIDTADTISGRVRGRFVSGGEGVPGRALLVPEGGGLQGEETLAEDGGFEFGGLPPGGYRLSLRSERHVFEWRMVRVEPGMTLELHDLIAESGVVLSVSCPGLTSERADGLRVLLGTSTGSYQLQRDPSRVSTWMYSRPLRAGEYRLIVLGAETLPVSKELRLAAGEQMVEFDAPAVGTPLRIRARLLDGDESRYGVIARGVVTIRGPGEPIVERFFGHFDDFDEKLVIRRFGLAPGRYTIEVRGVEKSASVEVEVGAEGQDVDIVVR